ncbi:hypothetical protein [Methylocystis sp. SC2]|uniref:hypothetical protein n=1 Tax=Methylocystis sp. (strain SC2) TaxID=187303 RepID=UPI00027AF160|nr:hypothetical protein [Methylocystis sp. SC2]CCJ08899.1 Hypothetical protein BN69_3448 [Methylocystis sp. SC2]
MKSRLFVATIISLLGSGWAVAEDAPVTYQCEVSAQQSDSSQSAPFSIEIRGAAVKLSNVSALDGNFSLIRKNDAFYVFKNKKNQGGNLNRSTGAVELYAVNAASHQMTVSINGACVEQK